MIALALIARLAMMQDDRPVTTVTMSTPVYSQVEEMSRTLEGLCRSRPFKVERKAGSPSISVTIDGQPQQFDRPGDVAAATRNTSMGLANFYCDGETFMVVVLQREGSPMRFSGTIRPRKLEPR